MISTTPRPSKNENYEQPFNHYVKRQVKSPYSTIKKI